MTAGVLGVIGHAVSGFCEEPYDWPLNRPRVLTSSFAEYRPARYHAGIDLRTGRIGEPVHAPADGYVSRVRCSPWGYGKAVYLTLEDGHVVVFGHLNDYMPELREYVRREQHKKKTYTVDLYPEPGRFAVKRGELVAWSGDTGVGPAHLHYEIRDAGNRVINPRLLGIAWPDDSPPTIRKVLVAPKDPLSTVDGDILPKVVPVRSAGGGTYVCDPVRISGRVGFGVDAIDAANQGETMLGVYRVKTLLGERELFRIQNDHVSYDTMHHGIVSWHPLLLKEGRFLLQWLWPGNQSECVRYAAGDGWMDAAAAPATVRIEVEDFLGNRAVVEIPVEPDEAPALNAEPAEAVPSERKGAVDVDCAGSYLVVTASFPSAEAEPPALGVADASPGGVRGVFRRIDATTYRAGYVPPDEAQWAALWADHPRLPGEIFRAAVFQRGQPDREETFGDVIVRAKERSPFGALFVRVEEVRRTPPQRLALLGKIYRIWPEVSPIDEPVEILFPFPAGAERAERVGIYRSTGSDWAMEETQRVGDRLKISTRRFGVFAAVEDTVAPSIRVTAPADGEKTSLRPAIRAAVSDVGSGIADITVTANDQWLLMEYDPEAGRIEWVGDEDLPPGDVVLSFRVRDRAGNAARVDRRIHTSGAASASG